MSSNELKYNIYKSVMSNVTTYHYFKKEDHKEAVKMGFSYITSARTKKQADKIVEDLYNSKKGEVPKIRKFDGNRYRLGAIHWYKDDAQSMAKKLRRNQKGTKSVRVVKYPSSYSVPLGFHPSGGSGSLSNRVTNTFWCIYTRNNPDKDGWGGHYP